MPETTALSETEIDALLRAELPGWTFTDNALQRIYSGPAYPDALQLLFDIGQLSERLNHHPDLLLHYKTLTIRYWTHTAKGITQRDVDLAIEAEKLIGTMTKQT